MLAKFMMMMTNSRFASSCTYLHILCSHKRGKPVLGCYVRLTAHHLYDLTGLVTDTLIVFCIQDVCRRTVYTYSKCTGSGISASCHSEVKANTG